MKSGLKNIITLLKESNLAKIILIFELIFFVVLLAYNIRPAYNIEFNRDDFFLFDDRALFSEEALISVKCNPENDSSRMAFFTYQFNLPYGAYELTLDYNTYMVSRYTDNAGTVTLSMGDKKGAIYTHDFLLFNKDNSATRSVWATALSGCNDINLSFMYNGGNDIDISRISINEFPSYRIASTILIILAVLLADYILYYLFGKKDSENKAVVLSVIFSVTFASLPLFLNYIGFGHDQNFHFCRIQGITSGLLNGELETMLHADLLHGYGYATPIFYPQLFLYLPAILCSLHFPLQTAYQIFLFTVNLSTCLVTCYCASNMAKNKKIGAFCAFLYTASAYRLANVYTRAAVGENLAMIFLPLIIYGIYVLYNVDDRKFPTLRDTLPLILGVTGLLQSHILSCELVAVFIVIFVLCNIRKTFMPKRLLSLLFCIAAVILINLGFLVPFLMSGNENIRVYSESSAQIQMQGAYLGQIFGIFSFANGESYFDTMIDDMSITIGFALTLCLALFMYVATKKDSFKEEQRRLFKQASMLFIFAMLAIAFSTRQFPWDAISATHTSIGDFLCTIQFPWRYLGIATVFIVMGTALLFRIIAENVTNELKAERVNTLIMILVAVNLVCVGFYMSDHLHHSTPMRIYSFEDIDLNTLGLNEYILTGTDVTSFSENHVVASDSVSVNSYKRTGNSIHIDVTNNGNDFSEVTIPRMAYDNYEAVDTQTGEVISLGRNEDNLIYFIVPPMTNQKIHIYYHTRGIWKLAKAISVFSFIALISLVIFQKNIVKKAKK